MKRIIIILTAMLLSLACHAFGPASVQSGTKVILDDVICEWDETSVYLVFPSDFTQVEAWNQEHELNNYFSNTPGLEHLYILMEKSDPRDPNINMNIYWEENCDTEEKVYRIDCDIFKVTIIQKPLIIQNRSLSKSGTLNGGNAAIWLPYRQSGVTYNLFRNGVFVQELYSSNPLPITQQGTYTLQAVVYNQNNYPATIAQGPIQMPGSVSFFPNDEDPIEQPVMETPVLALTQTQNYVTHFVSHDGSTSSGSITAKYHDGLGRPYQTVQFAATPTKKDLVTYQEYDALGRKSNTWLPAVASGNNGGLIYFANFKTKAINTYTDAGSIHESKPYAMSVYDASPLNRISEQYGPGALWHSNKRAVKTEYLANVENGNELNCINYTVTDHATTDTIMTIKRIGNYATNRLYVSRITDEDSNISFEFRNKLNQVILTRQLNREGNDCHDTYYLYDDFGNLRAVLPPIASDAMKTGGPWTSNTNATLKDYAYLYHYDKSNRCIVKKLPGAGYTRYVYDKSNRLIFSQDAKKQWAFSIPDSLGRVVLTGTFKTINGSSNIVNSAFENSLVVARYVTNGTHNNYTIYKDATVLNVGTPVYLITNYYDNYDFLTQSGFSGLTHSTLTGTEAEFNTRDTSTETTKTLLTGSIVGDAAGGTTKIYSAMYYDYRGRMIQSKSTNHLGGTEMDYFTYTFTGKQKKRLHKHKKTSTSTEVKELYTYDYDHAERLTQTTHQLNGGTVVKLSEKFYDDLGRLKTKKQHGSAANLSNYTYNLRGWLTGIFSGRFTQNLHYNDHNTLNTKSYNGNISSMTWKFDTGSTLRGYKFTYDNLNRLTEANYGEGETLTSNTGRFTEKVTNYDKHGNIKGIKRYGKTSSGYGLIDDLTFSYTGNQMKYVNDVIATNTVGQTFHFINRSTSTGYEYMHDVNGNMIKDSNKNISNIKYNLLNLPEKVQFSDNIRSAEYHYSAAGTKLKVTHKEGGVSKITDYCGNMIYEDGVLSKILTEEGYITLSSSTPTYHYYLNDHLGNNRVVLNINSSNVLTVEQMNSYYPFGGLFEQTAETLQTYKFGGKELDRTFSIDLYDYSARYMDGALGRFTTMDPLAEKYYGISPYAYCANNPVRFVDPDGRKVYFASGVSNEFKNNFMYAVQFLNQNSLGGMLAKLHESEKIYYISEGSISGFIPSKRTIQWDPSMGLLTTEGHVMSPTAVLNHEIDHALQHATNPEQMDMDLEPDGTPYSNAEERRVITGSEQITAKKLGEIGEGEVTRRDHSGYRYNTIGVTSTKGIYELDEVIVKPNNNSNENIWNNMPTWGSDFMWK